MALWHLIGGDELPCVLFLFVLLDWLLCARGLWDLRLVRFIPSGSLRSFSFFLLNTSLCR